LVELKNSKTYSGKTLLIQTVTLRKHSVIGQRIVAPPSFFQFGTPSAIILQACQGLDGLCLFLTQAWCVMPARMELVKLLSCKMYAQRLQDNSPENNQNRRIQSKLPVL